MSIKLKANSDGTSELLNNADTVLRFGSDNYPYDKDGERLGVSELADSDGAEKIGFLQYGTGAVARTVQSKMRDWVSVKDFGAVGDGVTDDTDAIQATIDFVHSEGGGFVFLPRGTYLVGSTIDVKSRVILQGEGVDATIIRPSLSSISTIRFPGVVNGTTAVYGGVRDMTVRAKWDQNLENTNSVAIEIINANRVDFSNISIFNAYKGMSFTQCSDVQCYDVHVHGGGGDQSYIGFQWEAQDFARNTVGMVRCVASAVAKYGFRMITASGSHLVNCEAVGDAANTTVEIGFYIGDGPSGNVGAQFLHFTNCLADQCKTWGWLVKKSANDTVCKDMQWANCWAAGTQGGTGRNFELNGVTSFTVASLLALSCDLEGARLINCNDGAVAGAVVRDFDRGNMAKSGMAILGSSNIKVTGLVAKVASGGSGKKLSVDTSTDVLVQRYPLSGVATIATGTSSITVTHGMGETPGTADIMVTPVGNISTAGSSVWWVGNRTATQFDILVNSALSASRQFAWRIEQGMV